MLHRDADVMYNGVDKDKIEKACPVMNDDVMAFHNNYIFERHNIYKRKEILGLPQSEWTDDEIFQKYRFTNVRRELDRESMWLIKNISENENLTLREKILNSMLFRTFNKSPTLELIGAPITDFENVEKYRPMFERYAELNPKYVFFTPAFNTGGLKASNAFLHRTDIYDATANDTEIGLTNINTKETKRMPLKQAKEFAKMNDEWQIDGYEPSMPMRMMNLIQHVSRQDIVERILNSKTQSESFEIIQEIKGFSKFLGYQIWVDLTYIPEFKYSENEFTVSGPGCHNGLNFLFKDRDGLTDEELLFWLRDNIIDIWESKGLKTDLNGLFSHLPEYDRCLNVMMLENSFCELGKYTKAKKGLGRPRVTYKPAENSNTRIQLENECTLDEWN